MKKKFSLWLNIVTICLCVCAIAIGVYAATSATLQVTGQIGFTAHGLEGSVTAATIEGHAVKNGADDKDGTPSEAVSLLSLKQDSTTEYVPVSFNDANGIQLGTKYFSDLGTADGTTTDIVIKLTISNTSKYDIVAYIDDSTTTLPTNVITNNDTIPSVKITANGGTGNLVIGLQLQKVAKYAENGTTITGYEYVDFDAPVTNNLSIQLGFDKYVAPIYTITPAGEMDINGSTGSEYSYLTTTMGKDSSGKDIRWYAIAKSTDGGVNFTSIAKTNTTEVTSGTYIFISEYILPTHNTNVGSDGKIAFTKNTNPNFAIDGGMNYNGSTVQEYLNGHGVDSFAKEYGISKSSLYANISAVNLSGESYDIRINAGFDVIGAGTTLATNNQKLWLLSSSEYSSFFGGMRESSGIGNFNGSADSWWLRSPAEFTDGYAFTRTGYSTGGQDYRHVGETFGIRAAFEVTIA